MRVPVADVVKFGADGYKNKLTTQTNPNKRKGAEPLDKNISYPTKEEKLITSHGRSIHGRMKWNFAMIAIQPPT